MIKKEYTVEVQEYHYFTGNSYGYIKFDTLKEALEYKRSKTYFIDSDCYSKIRLFRTEWVWKLDEPARPNKPLDLWHLEQELGVRFKNHKTVYYFGDNYADEFGLFPVYDHLAAWDLMKHDQRVYLAKISLDGEEVEEVMVEDYLPF